MKTFNINDAGCLKGKQGKRKRANIRVILDNLLKMTGHDPDQFEVNISYDGRSLATIVGDGCEFRGMDSKDLTVTVVVGNNHFVAKLNSKSCQPQTLNQDIRRTLGATGKTGFQFVGDQVYEKVKPKASDIKPQPQPQPKQPSPPVPMHKTIKATPDLKQSFLASTNILAAHMAIYKEIGNNKHHPFNREEAQEWISSNGITIKHHVLTGRIMGSLIRRGLYIKSDEDKVWIMTKLGDEVALGQKPLPADETPKKPRKKRAVAATPEEPKEGKAEGVSEEESQTGELQTLLLTIAGPNATSIQDLVETCNRLRVIDAERSLLIENKEKLIARLSENSAGVLVDYLRSLNLV
jgi:hypothetical protein